MISEYLKPVQTRCPGNKKDQCGPIDECEWVGRYMSMEQWMNSSTYIKGAHGILILRNKPRRVALLKTNNNSFEKTNQKCVTSQHSNQ